MVLPARFDLRRMPLRAMAPALSGFQGPAFLQGGSEGMPAAGPRACPNAAAPRAAMASWHLRVSKAPPAVTLAIRCSGGMPNRPGAWPVQG